MNNNNFTRAMKFVGQWEWGNKKDGAYHTHPNDPGGETKWGISKRAHPKLDIKNLPFDQAMQIYWNDYWIPAECNKYDLPLAVAMFDTAVNCGVRRALRWYDDAKTRSDPLKQLMLRRSMHYYSLVENNPNMKVFLKGWINRLNDLKKYCEILSTEEVSPKFGYITKLESKDRNNH